MLLLCLNNAMNPLHLPCRSAKLFQQQVAPVLEDAAGMSLTRVVTQHAGHTSELTGQLSLAAVDMLVFVGGDGTVFEGLQVKPELHDECDSAAGWLCCMLVCLPTG
jgi:diacylglycerol kinase family enzyme